MDLLQKMDWEHFGASGHGRFSVTAIDPSGLHYFMKTVFPVKHQNGSIVQSENRPRRAEKLEGRHI